MNIYEDNMFFRAPNVVALGNTAQAGTEILRCNCTKNENGKQKPAIIFTVVNWKHVCVWGVKQRTDGISARHSSKKSCSTLIY